MTPGVEIIQAAAADSERWDRYVRAHENGTMFHLFAWSDVIVRAYGYRSAHLLAVRNGEAVGVAPLIDVASPLLGHNLISTAFTVGGGVLADDDVVCSALAEAALEEGRRRKVGYVELRSQNAGVDGWAVKNEVYAGFERPIPPDEDDNLKAIPRKRRAEVRKAIAALESGALTARYVSDAEPFYSLYASALRDHGTPVFPKKFVQEILRAFPDETEILLIEADGEPVLALLNFYFGDTVLPYFFGAGPKSRANRAYDLAIWLTMRRGAERGFTNFDFGRSKFGTGSFAYKQHWGFEPKSLEYQYALVGAKEVPNVSPTNPKFAAVSAAWKRLPLPLANFAGPLLARHLA